ncbi:MAG: AAA family ATPase [Pyrinomonadaceae bacterium]
MLVGEPGVGKTAVIEGLARTIELEPEKVPANEMLELRLQTNRRDSIRNACFFRETRERS